MNVLEEALKNEHFFLHRSFKNEWSDGVEEKTPKIEKMLKLRKFAHCEICISNCIGRTM